jgi:hypothetical protein
MKNAKCKMPKCQNAKGEMQHAAHGVPKSSGM